MVAFRIAYHEPVILLRTRIFFRLLGDHLESYPGTEPDLKQLHRLNHHYFRDTVLS